jgi:hypothetical protein
VLALLWLAAAHADPAWPQLDEPTQLRTWTTLQPGPPARVSGPSRTGPVRAWTFSDGRVEHAELYAGATLLRTERFDAGGAPHTTVWWATGAPTLVTVYGAQPIEVPTAGWQPYALADLSLSLWLPPGAEPRGTGWQVRTAQGTWRVSVEPPIDLRAPNLLTEIATGAAGTLTSTAVAWLSGQPALRFTLDLPDPDQPVVAELWALPWRDHTVAIAFTAPPGALGLPALAPGRAAAALLHPTNPGHNRP